MANRRIKCPSWCVEWSVPAESPNSPTARALYEDAARLFNDCKYTAATEKFLPYIRYFPDHTKDVAVASICSTADAYGLSGRPLMAIELLTNLIDLLAVHDDMDSIRVARIWANLADRCGEHRQSHRKLMYLKVIAIPMLERNGAPTQEILFLQMRMAHVYGITGQPKKQADILQHVLDQRAFPDDHVETLRAKGNLANAYGMLQQYDKELELALKVLEEKESLYGRDHIELAKTLHNLAIAYGHNGNLAKKLECVNRSLAIKEARLEPTSEEILTTLYAKYSTLRDLVFGPEQTAHVDEYIQTLNRVIAFVSALPRSARHERLLTQTRADLAAANARWRS